MTERASTETIFGPSKRALTVSVMATIAIVAYNNLGVSAALPEIGNDLGDVALLPWTISAELLTAGVAVLAAGPLVDSLGARRVFRWSVVGFAMTSTLCGLAPSMAALVAARALQGVAAGMLLTATMAAIGVSYEAAARARVFAWNSTVWGVTSVAGPSIAALMVAVANWRGVFFFSVPVSLVAAVLAWNALPGPADETDAAPADARGIAIIAVIASAGLAVAEGSVLTLGLGSVVVVLGLVAYRTHASRVANPVVRPHHLLANRFRSVHTTSLLAVGGSLGFHAFLPVYLRGVRGMSATAAAFSVVYLSVGWTSGAIISTRLQDHLVREKVVLIGSYFLASGLPLTAVMVFTKAPMPGLVASLVITGLGVGSMSTTGINVLQERALVTEMGRLNAAHQFMRTMSITYGVGVAGAVILTTVNRRTGDVEAVRELLGGDSEMVGADVAVALAAGFEYALLVSCLAAAAAIPAALHLVRSRDEAVTSAA